MIDQDYVQLFYKRLSIFPMYIDTTRKVAVKAILTNNYSEFRNLCGQLRIADMQRELRDQAYYFSLAQSAIVATNLLQRAN